MKFLFTITIVLLSQMAFSQRWTDTAYNNSFNKFIEQTNTLIKKSHDLNAKNTNKKAKKLMQDSINLYALKVRTTLRDLDSIGTSLEMASYFANGKLARSQDLSSRITQLQCSYSHYMQRIRESKDSIPAIVNAALVLETHLKNGFPPSIYCPFIYDEVKFGPGLAPSKPPVKKIALLDSLKKEN